MIAYIKNDIPTPIELNEELNSTAYNLGSTYEDYENGKWVPLNSQQYDFYKENPNATIKEIWNMTLTKPEVNIAVVKAEKISEIDNYDKSSNVNGFYLNDVEVWINKDTRIGLMNSTNIHIEKGINETEIWFEGFSFKLQCNIVIQMLQDLEMYAYKCFNTTAKHKAAVNALEDVEQVKTYNYTTGYPAKLYFNTTLNS